MRLPSHMGLLRKGRARPLDDSLLRILQNPLTSDLLILGDNKKILGPGTHTSSYRRLVHRFPSNSQEEPLLMVLQPLRMNFDPAELLWDRPSVAYKKVGIRTSCEILLSLSKRVSQLSEKKNSQQRQKAHFNDPLIVFLPYCPFL